MRATPLNGEPYLAPPAHCYGRIPMVLLDHIFHRDKAIMRPESTIAPYISRMSSYRDC